MVRPIARKVLNAEYAAVRAPLAALDEKVTGKLPKQSRRRRAVEQSIGALDAVAGRVLPKKAPATKTPVETAAATKAPVQKAPATKTAAKKTAAKKTAAKKTAAKKTAAKKTAAKKTPARKSPAKKATR